MLTAEFTDAIALLKADHRKVEDLFEQFESTNSSKRKQALAHQICTELKIHASIEEEIFYPAFRSKIEDDMLDEALVEHHGAKLLINEIDTGSLEVDFYDTKVKVLSEEIKHHVHEKKDAFGRNVRPMSRNRRRSHSAARSDAGSRRATARADRGRAPSFSQADYR